MQIQINCKLIVPGSEDLNQVVVEVIDFLVETVQAGWTVWNTLHGSNSGNSEFNIAIVSEADRETLDAQFDILRKQVSYPITVEYL